MALAYSKNSDRSLYVRQSDGLFSEDRIDIAERRLRDKKQYLEDMQHEFELLQQDAFNIYKQEVMYDWTFNPGIINGARKWLSMINNKDNPINKRKKYEEKDQFKYLLNNVKKYFERDDIEITQITQYGYNNYADAIYFNCQGHKFELYIPNMHNISMKEYQYYGLNTFKMVLYDCDKDGYSIAIGMTYEESDLKDILNKFLASKLPDAIAKNQEEIKNAT